MKKKEGEILLLKEYAIIWEDIKRKNKTNKNNGIIVNPNARREFEITMSQRLDL